MFTTAVPVSLGRECSEIFNLEKLKKHGVNLLDYCIAGYPRHSVRRFLRGSTSATAAPTTTHCPAHLPTHSIVQSSRPAASRGCISRWSEQTRTITLAQTEIVGDHASNGWSGDEPPGSEASRRGRHSITERSHPQTRVRLEHHSVCPIRFIVGTSLPRVGGRLHARGLRHPHANMGKQGRPRTTVRRGFEQW